MASGSAVLDEPRTKTRRCAAEEGRSKRITPWSVVLHNSDAHTFDYVIGMLQQLFGVPRKRGKRIADEVHHTGRAVVYTGPKETAEFHRDRIHAYGKDPRISECTGSMSATIEPAAAQ